MKSCGLSLLLALAFSSALVSAGVCTSGLPDFSVAGLGGTCGGAILCEFPYTCMPNGFSASCVDTWQNSCSSNDDCGYRGAVCIQGKCSIYHLEGSVCDPSINDCQSLWCDSETSVCKGSIEEGSICAVLHGSGQGLNPCKIGLHCDPLSGVCVKNPGFAQRQNSTCSTQQPVSCEYASDCYKGQCRVNFGIEYDLCTLGGRECAPGYACVSGVCTAKPQSVSCTNATYCHSLGFEFCDCEIGFCRDIMGFEPCVSEIYTLRECLRSEHCFQEFSLSDTLFDTLPDFHLTGAGKDNYCQSSRCGNVTRDAICCTMKNLPEKLVHSKWWLPTLPPWIKNGCYGQ